MSAVPPIVRRIGFDLRPKVRQAPFLSTTEHCPVALSSVIMEIKPREMIDRFRARGLSHLAAVSGPQSG
jgi:hypothetical protein